MSCSLIMFPFSLARNFSAQLKSDFNLEGDLPSLSSNVAEHRHAVLTQRQELHRLEAQIEETDEALARAGIAPELSNAMQARETQISASGSSSDNYGGAGVGTAAAVMGAGAALGLHESDSQRMARDVYAERDYQSDPSIRRLGGEGFSMRAADAPASGVSSTYGEGSGYAQQPSQVFQSQQQPQQGRMQQAFAATGYANNADDQSISGQSQSHKGSHQQQDTTTSEQLLDDQEGKPMTPKATGYQQMDFSRPVKGGNNEGHESHGPTSSNMHSNQYHNSGFTSHTSSGGYQTDVQQQPIAGGGVPAHSGAIDLPSTSTGYVVPAGSVEVPYKPSDAY